MPGLCCVPKCNGKGGHKFPVNPGERKLWVQAVRRGEPNWVPSKWTKVCRSHFADSDYEFESKEKAGLKYRILRAGVVPHIFEWKRLSPAQQQREDRVQKKRKLEAELDRAHIDPCYDIGNEVVLQLDGEQEDTLDTAVTSEAIPRIFVESCTQTETSPGFSATEYMFDSKRFHFYTGVESYAAFRALFFTFGDSADELNYYYGTIPSMSLEDQFFLTLVKLRMAKTNFELSCMFKLSEKEVMNIFITWVNFLYFHFSEINWWPSRQLVRYYSPSDFKAKYPTTRVIIDGTEIPLKKPKQPLIQQATYSTYKNRNTIKALVGVTPGGLTSYVSDIYGGSTSDRQICERSELMTLCESGDSIMADKGFNVQDLFIPSNVKINIPEFFKKKNRMSAGSVMKDKKIASKRVHVERIIGLAKTFKILKQPFNNTESELSDAIISVCFYLCNFRATIVPTDA